MVIIIFWWPYPWRQYIGVILLAEEYTRHGTWNSYLRHCAYTLISYLRYCAFTFVVHIIWPLIFVNTIIMFPLFCLNFYIEIFFIYQLIVSHICWYPNCFLLHMNLVNYRYMVVCELPLIGLFNSFPLFLFFFLFFPSVLIFVVQEVARMWSPVATGLLFRFQALSFS